MKRAVPQDLNSVPFSVLGSETTEGHPRQTPEVNRTVRTSAAMLGLAFSVGAYGLAAPRQAEAATPTEPATSDLTPSTATSADAPRVSEPAGAATVTHTVQEGQTLWKIAELYGIEVAKLANLNGLQTTAVLSVGQTLQVPAANQTALRATPIQSMPDLKAVPVIPPQANASQGVSSTVVKRKQTALAELKQNRDRLKQSLAELKSEEPSKSESSSKVVATLPQSANPSVVTYRVNPGETLSSIAQAHGISARDLANLNQLTNPNFVQANQFIKVPQKMAQAQPATVAESQAPSVSQVQVPTVPSLASAQNPINPSVPLAVGGAARQVALTPSRSRSPEVQAVDVRRDDDQYVNTLMSEISRLRERYQSREAKREAPKASNAGASSRRVNPQFKSASQGGAASLGQTRLERMLADAPKPKSQVVATAPLGSESYTPILRSPVGKTVSPNLPPLGRSDAYMPGDRFKGYMWPAKGVLSSPYGWRWGRMHKGIDIAAPVGTPIVAAASGKVITAGWNDGGYGNLVEVEHADGSVTLYAHNNRILVRVGQQVRQGQQIAEMGSTGFSTGPHSHFEVHLPGRGAVNPVALLPQSRS
ncbi:peptidoglycan DD-metalloendopeptidase family protein [Leptolyngbya sp. FACHB-17]|uniref:peptidoglycan DD-metalloendopeptidase family protein n=1 Tax=unclassified Leptolyngbya TaxID=2650499 RepID=UPI001681823F|nr:peptidoglycan DD-metalloendopeptidase family protein [Leptolyngbya sp. FACHB-17]MBD2082743.1 peptidoglycan DD-metalloendopeptidase family protein [Leptolyngbya sp. FACHB-17]